MNRCNTVTDVRLLLSKQYPRHNDVLDKYLKQLLATVSDKSSDNCNYLKHAITLLKYDLNEIFKYREYCTYDSDTCTKIDNDELFKQWFPYVKNDEERVEIQNWLDNDRDFIYNAHGLRLLKNRYLLPKEPIQYCMLRIAKLFTRRINGRVVDLEGWRIMYDAISCGFMHTSSILADAENADKNIVPGEACRLVVADPNNDRALVNQINKVCNLISLGVGVGMSASTIPLNGYKVNGKIRSGFRSFAKKLDSCNYLSIYERKPKIAIYIEMHNDTIYEAFDLRNPLKNNHLENVFTAVMIPDYFVECYENDLDWYLFPSDTMIDGKLLSDYSLDEYKSKYQKCVEQRLYSKVVPSAKLMDDLVTCNSETGSPYIIWSDNVNRFSNHKHLGKIKTLNLCAEITNYASVEKSSSCTLMSVNFAMYKDFPTVFKRLYDYVYRLNDLHFTNELHSYFSNCLPLDKNTFIYDDMSTYAYVMGFIGTWSLNIFMGDEREYRELGVSPLGVFDMAIIGNVDPIDMIAEVSEAMYRGCIKASCKYSLLYGITCKYYHGSPFNQGIPQWKLRERDDAIVSDWNDLIYFMKKQMANSQLTAQAPTATTSMLVGVAESVTLPMSIMMARESENGRNDLICYGLLSKLLKYPNEKLILRNDIDRQILMYERSAPFIDQSQSTMFSIVLTRQNVLNLLMDTYYAQLKTAIYYILPKQINNTLTIVRDGGTGIINEIDNSSNNSMNININNKRKYDKTFKSMTYNNNDHADDGENSNCSVKRRPSCDSCSL